MSKEPKNRFLELSLEQQELREGIEVARRKSAERYQRGQAAVDRFQAHAERYRLTPKPRTKKVQQDFAAAVVALSKELVSLVGADSLEWLLQREDAKIMVPSVDIASDTVETLRLLVAPTKAKVAEMLEKAIWRGGGPGMVAGNIWFELHHREESIAGDRLRAKLAEMKEQPTKLETTLKSEKNATPKAEPNATPKKKNRKLCRHSKAILLQYESMKEKQASKKKGEGKTVTMRGLIRKYLHERGLRTPTVGALERKISHYRNAKKSDTTHDTDTTPG